MKPEHKNLVMLRKALLVEGYTLPQAADVIQRFWRNVNNYNGIRDPLNTWPTDISFFISNAFQWDYTPEKHDYWSCIEDIFVANLGR